MRSTKPRSSRKSRRSYHAREVARQRAKMENVPVGLRVRHAHAGILASDADEARSLDFAAAPRRRPAHAAGGRGRYPQRPANPRRLRDWPVRSFHAMRTALEEDGQIILFLNLRGYSPVLWCRGCGQAMKCPHCDISLTWHKDRNETPLPRLRLSSDRRRPNARRAASGVLTIWERARSGWKRKSGRGFRTVDLPSHGQRRDEKARQPR